MGDDLDFSMIPWLGLHSIKLGTDGNTESVLSLGDTESKNNIVIAVKICLALVNQFSTLKLYKAFIFH